ncbi:hypothetical protein [Streptomyces sp. NPDC000880]
MSGTGSSNGRYGAGEILRRRLIPRLPDAPADALLTDDGENFDPAKAWAIIGRTDRTH